MFQIFVYQEAAEVTQNHSESWGRIISNEFFIVPSSELSIRKRRRRKKIFVVHMAGLCRFFEAIKMPFLLKYVYISCWHYPILHYVIVYICVCRCCLYSSCSVSLFSASSVWILSNASSVWILFSASSVWILLSASSVYIMFSASSVWILLSA